MTRLQKKFSALRSAGKKGLIIYIMTGVPEIDSTVDVVLAAERAGADAVELGLPFSDPLADGPIIQAAGDRALQNGVTLKTVLDVVKKIRESSDIPLIGMGYINNVLHYGLDRFIGDFSAAGLDGLILPDVPHEEGEELRTLSGVAGLHLIEFVTPGTTPGRVKRAAESANGFVYAVSANGVTGVRETDYSVIGRVVKSVREHTDVPVAIGFGIGSPKAAREAAREADAVIVGSAVVKRLMDGRLDEAESFIASLRKAIDE